MTEQEISEIAASAADLAAKLRERNFDWPEAMTLTAAAMPVITAATLGGLAGSGELLLR